MKRKPVIGVRGDYKAARQLYNKMKRKEASSVMNNTRPEPTYAYMKDAKGFCWAVCAFIHGDGDILYAWTVRAKCDHDHRPTAKKLLGYRLNHLWFGDESWRRPFRKYRGKRVNRRRPVEAIRIEDMDKCGTWRDSPDAFRGALERIRNRIALMNVDHDPPAWLASGAPNALALRRVGG